MSTTSASQQHRPATGSRRPAITYIGPVPPFCSGPAQHGGYLVEALSRRASVQVLSWRDQYPQLLFRHTQRTPDVEPHPGARFDLSWWNPVSWRQAGRAASAGDLVVLAWTTPFHALPYATIIRAARPARAVAIVHNAVPHEKLPLQTPLTRWTLSRCAGAVTHAATVARELDGVVPGLGKVTLPMPAHLDVRLRPLPPPEPFRLLFFGHVRPYKGLDLALDALAHLAARGQRHRLTVAGEFWEPPRTWQERIEELGLTDQVDLRPGYVPCTEVDDLMSRHHAVILPYRHASQSGIAPISLAAGRPVIASAVGGLTEVVHDGINGTVATPGDVGSLAGAIERCRQDLPALADRTTDLPETWDDVARAVLGAAGLGRQPGGPGRGGGTPPAAPHTPPATQTTPATTGKVEVR